MSQEDFGLFHLRDVLVGLHDVVEGSLAQPQSLPGGRIRVQREELLQESGGSVRGAEVDRRVIRLRVPLAAVGAEHVVPGGLARPVLDLGLVRRVVVREQELLGDPPVPQLPKSSSSS